MPKAVIFLVFSVIIGSGSCKLLQKDIVINEPLMHRAAVLSDSGEWGKAAEIWTYLANNGKPGAAARASCNMIAACDALERRDLAINWAVHTIEMDGSPRATHRAKAYLNRMIDSADPYFSAYAAAARDRCFTEY